MEKVVVAKAVLFDPQGRILLLLRGKTAPRRPLEWDLPGGIVDDSDESYQHACIREVSEETGVEVRNNQLELAYTESDIAEFGNGTSAVSWLYFEGEVEHNEVTISWEHDDFRWATLQEAQELITYNRQLKALGHIAAVRLRSN